MNVSTSKVLWITAGLFALSAELASMAMAGDTTFQNNLPDPLLTGSELPSFKFELEKSEAKVIGDSTAREASVRQLPISKNISGVSMRLAPGAIREPHWHANAAEWAFVNEGKMRTTVIAPDGHSETNDFDPGDIWYFPRGHGHMLQCISREPCHFILIFDNGYFSEFGTFSITDWIGGTPADVLAKNFNVPASTFAKFPKKEVYFAQGPLPPQAIPPNLRGPSEKPPQSHKFSMLALPPQNVHKGGREWMVDAQSFPISKTITGVILELEPGGLRELHWHPNADEWQYILAGKIRISMFGSGGRFRKETMNKGDVGYMPQGYGHSIENIGDQPSRILIGLNTGTYQKIDLSEWIAGNPIDVLTTTFGQPAAVFKQFPRNDVYIAPDGRPQPRSGPQR